MNQVCKFVKKGTYLERQGQIVWSNLFEIRGREIVVTTVVDKLDRHLTWLSVKSHNLNHMGKLTIALLIDRSFTPQVGRCMKWNTNKILSLGKSITSLLRSRFFSFFPARNRRLEKSWSVSIPVPGTILSCSTSRHRLGLARWFHGECLV